MRLDALSPGQQDALVEFLKSLQVLPPGSRSLVVDENGSPKRWAITIETLCQDKNFSDAVASAARDRGVVTAGAGVGFGRGHAVEIAGKKQW